MILDLFVVGYVSYAAWRGRKRGLVKELPSAFSITVFCLSGWGLFKIMFRGLEEASKLTGQSVGLLTFIGLIVGAVVMWRRMQARLRWVAEKCVPENRQPMAGAIAGGVRAFVLVATLLLILAHWPLHGLTRGFVQSSFTGRVLVRVVLPVYEKTHSR